MTIKASGESESFDNYSTSEKALKKFAKQMLKNHIFTGIYTEQRFVPDFNCYQKIVRIADNEKMFIENIRIVKTRLDNFYKSSVWIGITYPNVCGAPIGYNLWVEIDQEIFGTYKFKVQDVKFMDKKVTLKLQILGTSADVETEAHTELLQNSDTTIPDRTASTNDECEDKSLRNLLENITYTDVKEGIIFISVLAATIVVGGANIIMYLLDYMLKLLRELSGVIRAVTPICIACFDTIAKIFGYISFLLAMLWRDRHGPPKHQQQPPQIYNYSRYSSVPMISYKSLPYERSSVKITPLD